VVLATKDLEVTVHTPVLVPGVSNPPVLDTVLNTPTEDLDSVATEVLTGDVLVDTRLVVLEVSIDIESSLDRTVSHDLLLEVRLTTESVGGVEADLVTQVRHRVVGLGVALVSAGRSVIGRKRWARSVLASGVVVAVGEGVGKAAGEVVVVTTRDDTSALDPAPSRRGVTTLAAETAGSAAGEEVSSREVGLDLALGSNAETVSSSLSSTESPAGTAVGLVTDLRERGALWPSLASIELLRDVSNGAIGLAGEDITTLASTAETAGLVQGAIVEPVIHTSNPGSSGVAVDLIDDADALEDGALW